MPTWSVVDKSTGLFTGQRITAPTLDEARASMASDAIAVEGAFDHLAQRFDLGQKKVIARTPPTVDPQADEREARRVLAKQEIDRLERKSLRAIREATGLQGLLSVEAKKRLVDIETAIATQREIIRANK